MITSNLSQTAPLAVVPSRPPSFAWLSRALHRVQAFLVQALAYTHTGSGKPPLVLLHGWAGDHTVFTPQIDHFSQNYRTTAVDLRGHGQSDKPAQDYTMAGLADDIVWLCTQLGITKPVIIGHSMGGTIALELAARYPELPAAIIMIDSVVFPRPGLRENELLPMEPSYADPAIVRESSR